MLSDFTERSRFIRTIVISVLIGVAASLLAQVLLRLIDFFTHLSFYGELAISPISPWYHQLGWKVIFVPIIGALVVGLMARFGSKAIRGHGIPEVMEKVLFDQSRIPPRITILKPLATAIAIGTGGPFGAEGPIIATGGSLGSLIGQLMHTTANERKVFLAAGAAAGMAAVFGTPVAAVLLAIELLLFEFSSRSFIAVSLACVTATGIRVLFEGSGPVFEIAPLPAASGEALIAYVLAGAVVGLVSVAITRAVYFIEDRFDRLTIPWMFWPAIGAVAVGVIGYFFPRTLGVGYENIQDILSGSTTLAGTALGLFALMKFLSWSISLGSGTSGGTLAPLLTLGGALGSFLGMWGNRFLPHAGIDPRMAALVGMAAMFAGASRALLASVVFAFEATYQSTGLLPLLGGCTMAYLISSLLMKETIMTEKISRRGLKVPHEYIADYLSQKLVKNHASQNVVILEAHRTVISVLQWIESQEAGSSHQGFPILDVDKKLLGVITRKDLLKSKSAPDKPIRELITRKPITISGEMTMREASDRMIVEEVGRLVVIDEGRITGIITRSDVLKAHTGRIQESRHAERGLKIGMARR